MHVLNSKNLRNFLFQKHRAVSGRLKARIAGSHLTGSVSVSVEFCVLYYEGTDLKADWQRVFSRPFSVQTALTLRRLMSYIYGAPILDVSRSHTTTQHSR